MTVFHDVLIRRGRRKDVAVSDSDVRITLFGRRDVRKRPEKKRKKWAQSRSLSQLHVRMRSTIMDVFIHYAKRLAGNDYTKRYKQNYSQYERLNMNVLRCAIMDDRVGYSYLGFGQYPFFSRLL